MSCCMLSRLVEFSVHPCCFVYLTLYMSGSLCWCFENHTCVLSPPTACTASCVRWLTFCLCFIYNLWHFVAILSKVFWRAYYLSVIIRDCRIINSGIVTTISVSTSIFQKLVSLGTRALLVSEEIPWKWTQIFQVICCSCHRSCPPNSDRALKKTKHLPHSLIGIFLSSYTSRLVWKDALLPVCYSFCGTGTL